MFIFSSFIEWFWVKSIYSEIIVPGHRLAIADPRKLLKARCGNLSLSLSLSLSPPLPSSLPLPSHSLFLFLFTLHKKWLITPLGSPVARCFPKPNGEHRFGNNVGRSTRRLSCNVTSVAWSSRPRSSSLERGESILPSALCPLLSDHAAKYCRGELSVDSWPHLRSSHPGPNVHPSPFPVSSRHAPYTVRASTCDEILMTPRFLWDYLWLRDPTTRSLNLDSDVERGRIW